MMSWQQEMEHILGLLFVGFLYGTISVMLIQHQENHITRECFYDVLCSWKTVSLKLIYFGIHRTVSGSGLDTSGEHLYLAYFFLIYPTL